MGSTPVRCRLGLHTWVRVHVPHGQSRVPDRYVCHQCRKSRTASIPLGMLGG